MADVQTNKMYIFSTPVLHSRIFAKIVAADNAEALNLLCRDDIAWKQLDVRIESEQPTKRQKSTLDSVQFGEILFGSKNNLQDIKWRRYLNG